MGRAQPSNQKIIEVDSDACLKTKCDEFPNMCHLHHESFHHSGVVASSSPSLCSTAQFLRQHPGEAVGHPGASRLRFRVLEARTPDLPNNHSKSCFLDQSQSLWRQPRENAMAVRCANIKLIANLARSVGSSKHQADRTHALHASLERRVMMRARVCAWATF